MKKLVTAVIVFVLFVLTAYAVDFAFIYDDAELFSYSEEQAIKKAASTVYDESGLLCVVVTDYGIGDMLSMLPAYAGGAVDMVMLTVDMSAREFEIYQYNAEEGESAFRISYSESENILDGIFDDMAEGDYAAAALLFVDMAENAFVSADDFYVPDGADDYEYIDYPEYDGYGHEEEVFSIGMIFLPLLCGIGIGGISVLCVWLSYKKKVHGSTYPLSQYSKLDLTDSKDNFITKNVVVTRIPDPPSSSGGHSGGGGFRGGGGGARMGGRKF